MESCSRCGDLAQLELRDLESEDVVKFYLCDECAGDLGIKKFLLRARRVQFGPSEYKEAISHEE